MDRFEITLKDGKRASVMASSIKGAESKFKAQGVETSGMHFTRHRVRRTTSGYTSTGYFKK